MTESTDWVAVARTFRSAIERASDDAERERCLPTELVDAWRDAGLFNLWVPREYGGQEVDFTTFLGVVEEVAAADGSAGWTLMIGASGAVFAAYLPPETARTMFESGRTVMAGSVTPRKAATAVDGGYRVSARWPFASGIPNADWVVGFSLVPENEPAPPAVSAPGFPPLLALAVPAISCRIVDTWTSMGLRATSSHDFELDEVFVPKAQTYFAGEPPAVSGAMYRAGARTILQLGLVGVHLGIARSAVEAVIELANQKTPTLRPSKLRESQVAQRQVGRAEALRLSARAFALDTLVRVQAALESDGALSLRHLAEASLMAAEVARACAEAVDLAYEVGGTTGVYAGNKLERCFRDIHVATQHMGVSPNQFAAGGLMLFNQAQSAPVT
jgi:alkylation response protein AidB-like acyl-CoA dehydrogenase